MLFYRLSFQRNNNKKTCFCPIPQDFNSDWTTQFRERDPTVSCSARNNLLKLVFISRMINLGERLGLLREELQLVSIPVNVTSLIRLRVC